MDEEKPLSATQKVWRVKILSATWLSYAGFYFCRKNFSIVKSSLQDVMQISKTDLAHIFTAYLFAYMCGQFLTSFLGRKKSSRILLLSGMAITLIVNIFFGFTFLMGPAGYYPFIALMIINGFAQATGWPGNVGVLSNWLRSNERGKIMALWATCYQIGSILAKMFAAFMLGWLGATWSFWGASIVMFGVWIFFFLFERDTPEDAGIDPIIEEVEVPLKEGETPASETGMSRDVLFTIMCMGSSYFVFKFLRYALDSWSPMAIEEMFNTAKDEAGYISTAFDWVGFLGVLFSGWFSDKVFKGRRYQTTFLMTLGMFAAFLFLATIGTSSLLMFTIGLSFCGFMLMGPDSLLSGTGAIDVGGRKHALMAAGIINGMGSIGPVFQEEIIGWVLQNYGYASSFNLMVVISFIGIFGTGYLGLRARKGLTKQF